MEKIYHKNVLEDLLGFKKTFVQNWNQANTEAAKEWDRKKPKTEKEFIEYYEKSNYYLDAMATYTRLGKKMRLIEKILKVIKTLKVKTIVDFGCGVGSDSLFLDSLGYSVISMDLGGQPFNFFKFRLAKHNVTSIKLSKIKKSTKIPDCDLILSLDTLEHVFNPFETINLMVKNKPKYLLLTTAFGVHSTSCHKIPMHTDYNVHKIEKYIESKGYKKKKLKVAFPPRLFIKN